MDLIYARRINNQLCINYIDNAVNDYPGNGRCEGRHTEELTQMEDDRVRASCNGKGAIPCNGCDACDIITDEKHTLIGWTE